MLPEVSVAKESDLNYWAEEWMEVIKTRIEMGTKKDRK